MQQGGVSKATKMLNLSEDIFAGMDFTLRGPPRSIVHREYLHVGKGRDLGFNSAPPSGLVVGQQRFFLKENLKNNEEHHHFIAENEVSNLSN